MKAHRRAVLGRGDDRDLELARQIAEFRMEGAPLAQQLGPRARIGDFVGSGTGILIGRDIADAVAADVWMACISTAGEIRQNVRRIAPA